MKTEKLKIRRSRKSEIENRKRKLKIRKLKNRQLNSKTPSSEREHKHRKRERESSTKRESFRWRRFRRLLFDLVKSTLSSENFLVIPRKGGGFDRFFAGAARPSFLFLFLFTRERVYFPVFFAFIWFSGYIHNLKKLPENKIS